MSNRHMYVHSARDICLDVYVTKIRGIYSTYNQANFENEKYKCYIYLYEKRLSFIFLSACVLFAPDHEHENHNSTWSHSSTSKYLTQCQGQFTVNYCDSECKTFHWQIIELPYWFKVTFFPKFWEFIPLVTQNTILHEMRFNPWKVRLNFQKFRKFRKSTKTTEKLNFIIL